MKEKEISDYYEKLYEKKEIPLILGNITKEDVSKFDLLVLSPGISVNAPIAQMFRDQEKPVWSEIELAYQASKGRIAAITGTNGKTTTTAIAATIQATLIPSQRCFHMPRRTVVACRRISSIGDLVSKNVLKTLCDPKAAKQ